MAKSKVELDLERRRVRALEQIAENGRHRSSDPGYQEPKTLGQEVRDFFRGPWGMWNV